MFIWALDRSSSVKCLQFLFCEQLSNETTMLNWQMYISERQELNEPDFKNLLSLRENFKYYFADFVRKGGGGTPQIRNSLFAENFVRKGGGGVPPISVTYFLDQKHF